MPAPLPDNEDTVRLLTSKEMQTKLRSLGSLLANLSDSLPLNPGHYNFVGFSPSSEAVDDFGEEGALNHALEIAFGSRAKGPIQLRGRGNGLCAVVVVLEKYIARSPKSAILQKWVEDLITAAGHYQTVRKDLQSQALY